MHSPFKNFLVIDIETVSSQEHLDGVPTSLQTHWEKKTSSIKNPDDKSVKELYQDRAAIYAEFGKVVVIGMAILYQENGVPSLRIKALASHDEKALLTDFKAFLESKFDQDNLRLCAHNGKEFDFPYLCRRMLLNDIKIPWSLNMSGKKPWEVHHVDTMELWKFGDWKSYTSLDLLTTLFDIPSSKSEMDGSMVSKVYYESEEGLEKIATYCKQDVLVTAQLYLRLNNLPLIADEHITIL